MFDIYKKDHIGDIKHKNNDNSDVEKDVRILFKDRNGYYLYKKDGKWTIKRKKNSE
jgi:hypothetical protein